MCVPNPLGARIEQGCRQVRVGRGGEAPGQGVEQVAHGLRHAHSGKALDLIGPGHPIALRWSESQA